MKNTSYISTLLIASLLLSACVNSTPISPERRAEINKERQLQALKEQRDVELTKQRVNDIYARGRRGDILFCTLEKGFVDLKKWRTYEPSYFEIARGEAKEIRLYVPHRKIETKLWAVLSPDANRLRICQSEHYAKRKQHRYNSTDNYCGEARGLLELRHTRTVKKHIGINSRLKNAQLRCSIADEEYNYRRSHNYR